MVVGATAVGKTDLNIRLAKHFGVDIINADSRQLYSQMPIGTAAPTAEQLSVVQHYFVGILRDVRDYYSAAQYENDVVKHLQHMDGNALMSGGSMLYVDAVCNGIDKIPTISDGIRSDLQRSYNENGLERLVAELRYLDPEYYKICDLRNPKRVIHAIEVCYQSGTTYTSFRTHEKKQRPFHIIKVGLERPRHELYERISNRVDEMIETGLLDEVKQLLPYRACNALNTVGYKELFAYLDGEISLNFAIEKIKRNTRIYSRKQMTWFKKDSSIRWFHPDDLHGIISYINSNLRTVEYQ